MSTATDLAMDGELVPVQLDMTDKGSVERLAALVERDYGRIVNMTSLRGSIGAEGAWAMLDASGPSGVVLDDSGRLPW